MKLQATEVFAFIHNNYRESHKKYDKIGFVLEGSSGSSKTTSIIQFLQLYSQSNRNKKITCGRSKMTWTIPSIWTDFQNITLSYQLNFKFNKSKYEAENNGNVFRFIGADDPQKFHGPRQDVFWFNEAIELAEPSFNQVNMRTNELWFLDFNPSTDDHWIFKKTLANMQPHGRGKKKITKVFDEQLGRDITECIFYFHSTWRDNGYLPAGQRKVIMGYEPTEENIANGTADQWHYEVYNLGMRAVPKGAIFPYWKDVNELPAEIAHTKPLCRWLDFGFSNDPTAIGGIWFHKGELWVKEDVYETGLTNIISSDLSVDEKDGKKSIYSIDGRLTECGVGNDEIIICDAAEQKSACELRLKNWQVYWLGKDTVKVGISRLKKYKVNIVNSPNISNERRNYKWRSNPITGEFFDEPIDKFNHHIDGIRYAVKYLETQGII